MVKLVRMGCNCISLHIHPNAGNINFSTWHDQNNRKTLPGRYLEAAQEGRKIANLILRIGGIAWMAILLKYVFQRRSAAIMKELTSVGDAPEAGGIKFFQALRVAKAHIVY